MYCNEKLLSSSFLYVIKSHLKQVLLIGGLDFNKLKYYYPLDVLGQEVKVVNKDGIEDMKVKKSKQKDQEGSRSKYIVKHRSEYYLQRIGVSFEVDGLSTVDLGSIDYVLVSSVEEFYMLPLLQDLLRLDKTKVVATKAVAQMGKVLLESLVDQLLVRDTQATQRNLCQQDNYSALSHAYEFMESNYHQNVQVWRGLPSKQSMATFIESITTVNYGEVLGDDHLSIVAQPSGHFLGGAVWELLHNQQDKILVLTAGSFEQYLHSQSLCLPQEQHFSSLICLEDFNVLPSGKRYDAQISSLFYKMSSVIKNGMAVVLPVKHPLFLLDLMDQLRNRRLKNNLVVLGGGFKQLVDLGNINVESLNKKLQDRIYQDTPETPFYSYEVLKQDSRLNYYDDLNALLAAHPGYTLPEVLHQLKENQTIYIVCDHTLRLGMAVHLIMVLHQAYSGVQLVVTENMSDRAVYEEFKDVLGVEVQYSPLDHRYSVGRLLEELNNTSSTYDHLVLPSLILEQPDIGPALDKVASRCQQVSYYDDEHKQLVSLPSARPLHTPEKLQSFLSSRMFQEDKYEVVFQQKEQPKYTTVHAQQPFQMAVSSYNVSKQSNNALLSSTQYPSPLLLSPAQPHDDQPTQFLLRHGHDTAPISQFAHSLTQQIQQQLGYTLSQQDQNEEGFSIKFTKGNSDMVVVHEGFRSTKVFCSNRGVQQQGVRIVGRLVASYGR